MGRIVSIHSFRGGTGKSTITSNLAYCCAAKGLRAGIVDTDIQSPGVHVIFGLKESSMKYCLNDYLQGECPINEAVYDVSEKYNLKPGSLNLIPSRLRAEEIVRMLKEGFDVPRLSRGLSELIEKCTMDVLFIDTHPGIEDETLLSIAISDLLVVILRPDEQDYLGTAITLEIARRMEVPKMFLIANRVPPEFEIEPLKRNLEETYKLPVAGILPFSYSCMLAQSREMYSYTYPNDPFSSGLKAAAEKIMEQNK
jgi:septum site-determining protein MinD